MNISLTPQLEAFVKDKVATGLYGNASEVVREALRLLHEQDELQGLKRERLRRALIDGERSGAAEAFDMDDIQAELDAPKVEVPAR